MGFVPETSGRSDAVARDMERIAKRLRALEGGGGAVAAASSTSQSTTLGATAVDLDGMTVTFDARAGRQYLVTFHQPVELTSGSVSEILVDLRLGGSSVASSGYVRSHSVTAEYLAAGQYLYTPGSNATVTFNLQGRVGIGSAPGRAFASGARQASLVVVDLGAV